MTERIFFIVLLTAASALACFDHLSPMAKAVRQETTIAALLSLRPPSSDAVSEGASATPAAYLLIYHPTDRALDFIYLSNPRLIEDHVQKASWILPIPMPQKIAPPYTPDKAKAWFWTLPRDIRYWGCSASWIAQWRIRADPHVTLYDAWLLAWETFKISPEKVRMRWLASGDADRRLLQQLWERREESADTRADVQARGLRAAVTIQVLNASEQPGVALQATKVLRLRGLDVMEFGNAAASTDRTHFWDRTGNFAAAARVARLMGCPQPDVTTRLDPRSPADVTVVLGRDFNSCTKLAGLARE